MKLLIMVAMFAALTFGGPAAAHEIGDKLGPVWTTPGGAMCDTEDRAKQAIDVYDSGQGKMPANCGILRGDSRVLLEVVGMHESSRRTYIILKITFLPPSALGVQYGWQTHSKAPNILGDPV